MNKVYLTDKIISIPSITNTLSYAPVNTPCTAVLRKHYVINYVISFKKKCSKQVKSRLAFSLNRYSACKMDLFGLI